MPMHDWSRVDANVYHHFHQRWSIAICDRLNEDGLPEEYSALVEQHATGLIPDVLGVQRRPKSKPVKASSGAVATLTPPQTQFMFRSKPEQLLARANRIAIRHRLGEVVCVIEIVSPGNKSGKPALRNFVAKTKEFLDAGVNVLIVDPFPPTPRDPGGIHKAVWDEVQEEEPFELPAGEPLTLAAYVAGDLSVGEPIRAYVETFAVGRAMKDMPAYLDADFHVPVPLESTYMAAWKTCPADMRYLVEHGKLPDE